MDKISHQLLTEALPESLRDKSVLLMGCQNTMIQACLQKEASLITAVHLTWPSYEQAITQDSVIHLFRDPALDASQLCSYDLILFPITKSAQQTLKIVHVAQKLLVDDGILHCAGLNSGGIKGLALKLKKQNILTTVVANKRGGRVLALSNETIVTVKKYETVKTEYLFRNNTISVDTVPGLFSFQKSDKGSQLLLDNFPKCTGKKVLDVGCGSGILSIAATMAGAAEVQAVDYSATAIQISISNGKEYPSITVQGGDMATTSEGYYDLIITNPPFHDGLKTDLSTGERWLDSLLLRLHKGGVVWLVANAFIAYGIMGRKRFSQVNRIAEENGFIVYKMVK